MKKIILGLSYIVLYLILILAIWYFIIEIRYKDSAPLFLILSTVGVAGTVFIGYGLFILGRAIKQAIIFEKKGGTNNKDLNKKNESTVKTLDNNRRLYFGLAIVYVLGERLRNKGYIVGTLYIVRIIIKRPLVIGGILLAIYSIIKFVKRCREN